jgi:hypothetical protein
MRYILICLLAVCTLGSYAQVGAKISDQRKLAIDSLALEKVKDLSKYISVIGDKATPWSVADRAITRTLELFMDGSQMGVSNLATTKVRYYPIKKYLERLMLMNYQKVNIEWFNIQYVSDLEQMTDGRYIGVITIYQRFEGVTKEGLKYVDTTKKDITIYVERKKTQIQGIEVSFWDVLLGDIRVKETKKG